jgi:hypothetical protein
VPKAKGRRLPSPPHIAQPVAEPRPTNHLKPHFSLYHLEDGFRVSDCQAVDKGEFAQRLQELSQLTWNQIVLAPRQGFGSETIALRSIKVAVPNHITDDRRLLAFRFGDAARIVGYREDQIFHIVWIDPNHNVY